MHKALVNTALFVTIYAIFMLPTYFLAHTNASSLDHGVANVLTLPFMLYLLSMVVLCSLSLIRGMMIGKPWLVLITVVAFAFNLMPTLNAIPFVPYVYHVLAIIIGAACPLLAVSPKDTFISEH